MTAVRSSISLLVFALLSILFACGKEDEANAAWPPPPPAVDGGIQLHVGPFDVAAGTEIHKCVVQRMEDSLLVNQIESWSTDKSHHFAADVTIVNIPEGTFDCRDVFTSEVMANSMTVYSTDRAHNLIDFPAGSAGKLPAKYARVILSFHYVNPTKEARHVEGFLNLYTTDPKNVQTLVNGIVGSVDKFTLPPRSPATITGTCTVDRAVDVIALTGHAHQQLTSFELRLVRGGVRPEAPDYHTTEWSGPPLDVRSDAPIHLEPGDAIEWTCNYQNPTDAPITEGESTSQEMCMAIVVYLPDQGFLACRVTPSVPKGKAKQQTPPAAL